MAEALTAEGPGGAAAARSPAPAGGRVPLGELILLAAAELSSDPSYGATKLNKALFFSDFLHYKRHGSPITGATYERLPRGPAPKDIVSARQALVDAGDARLERVGYLGYVQARLVALRTPAGGTFGDTQTQMVRQACAALAGHSHANVLGWQLAAERETIPYESIFLASATPVRDDLEGGRTLAVERGLTGTGSPPRPPAGRSLSEPSGPGDRRRRQVDYECPVDRLRTGYPRGPEVFAGVEWALARWPEGAHRIPGTRLSVLRTEWPVPSLRVYVSLPGEGRCTVWAIDEVQPYTEAEDGSD